MGSGRAALHAWAEVAGQVGRCKEEWRVGVSDEAGKDEREEGRTEREDVIAEEALEVGEGRVRSDSHVGIRVHGAVEPRHACRDAGGLCGGWARGG